MPLHDWSKPGGGWEGVHHSWLTELLRWIKPRLPAKYRAYIGSLPTIGLGTPSEKSDIGIRQWAEEQAAVNPAAEALPDEPDEEIAIATLDPATAVYVEIHGCLVAAVELISPRNKDRLDSRATYLGRYLGYLEGGVNLLLVDVHQRARKFSFADRIAEELEMRQVPCPPPMAVSYRVGGPAATGGRMLGIWRRPLTLGAPLPVMQLALSPDVKIPVDLEQIYMHAAADAYLA